MIVLDTDHLSILQHHDSTGAAELRQRFLLVDNEDIVTTVISYEEQARSWLSQIGRHSDIEKQIPFYNRLIRFADFFAEWTLLPLNEEAAATFQSLRKQKIRISSTDLKIASIVVVHEATLLTRNLSDFEKIPGLSVDNWLPI